MSGTTATQCGTRGPTLAPQRTRRAQTRSFLPLALHQFFPQVQEHCQHLDQEHAGCLHRCHILLGNRLGTCLWSHFKTQLQLRFTPHRLSRSMTEKNGCFRCVQALSAGAPLDELLLEALQVRRAPEKHGERVSGTRTP